MKRIVGLLLVLLLCLCFLTPAFEAKAETAVLRLVDDADLLTNDQEETLLSDLNELSEKWDMDVVIVTADFMNGNSVEDYSDYFYSQGGYNSDGILLLVSMEVREFIIEPFGKGERVFTVAGREYILDQMEDKLSDGEYNEAFDIFVRQCDDFFQQDQKGEPYDTGNLPKEPFNVVKSLLISLVVGLVIALIATGIMRGQLKSVRAQPAADNYVKSGSLNITHKQDLFLYRNVTRREKPKNNSGSRGLGSSGGGQTVTKRKF